MVLVTRGQIQADLLVNVILMEGVDLFQDGLDLLGFGEVPLDVSFFPHVPFPGGSLLFWRFCLDASRLPFEFGVWFFRSASDRCTVSYIGRIFPYL